MFGIFHQFSIKAVRYYEKKNAVIGVPERDYFYLLSVWQKWLCLKGLGQDYFLTKCVSDVVWEQKSENHLADEEICFDTTVSQHFSYPKESIFFASLSWYSAVEIFHEMFCWRKHKCIAVRCNVMGDNWSVLSYFLILESVLIVSSADLGIHEMPCKAFSNLLQIPFMSRRLKAICNSLMGIFQ